MPKKRQGVERFEQPQGLWVNAGSWQFRIVENTIGGHVWEKRPAPKRVRKRDDARRFDERSRDAL